MNFEPLVIDLLEDKAVRDAAENLVKHAIKRTVPKEAQRELEHDPLVQEVVRHAARYLWRNLK